jgi:cell division protease FtsH
MDGFDTKDGVIILAATNRPDVLDPALLRPGRFDRQVVVAMPDVQEREDILNIHMKKIPVDPAVDAKMIARATPGTSGADLANLVNEAALFAIRKDQSTVVMADFEEARDKILMGAARKSLFITDDEKKATAFHEAGHALTLYYLKHADPLHKVTVIPRGQALGLALALPEKDAYSHTKSWLEDYMVFAFGGYAAEKIIYGETTTGTAQDIKQATGFARKMVCEWGMSDELGPVSYGQEEEPIFIGKEIAQHKDYSEDTAKRIDGAVQSFLENAMARAQSILSEHRDQLERLASELITRETLLDEDIRELFSFPPRKVEA